MKRTDASGGSRRFWICRCDCGTERRVAADNLHAGSSASCGCVNATAFALARTDRGRYVIEPGTRFGSWTVLRDVPNGPKAKVICRCACGAEHSVAQQNLLRGLSLACPSCASRDTYVEGGRTPARRYRRVIPRPPEYETWKGILKRCRLHPGYRQRTVCLGWRESFDRFLADVGPRPSPDHSIDRIDNDKGYEPGNVRWATWTEQARNKGNNKRLTAFGQTKCMSEWAAELGIAPATIFGRLARGWSVEKAVSTKRLAGRRRLRKDERFRSVDLVGIMGMGL